MVVNASVGVRRTVWIKGIRAPQAVKQAPERPQPNKYKLVVCVIGGEQQRWKQCWRSEHPRLTCLLRTSYFVLCKFVVVDGADLGRLGTMIDRP